MNSNNSILIKVKKSTATTKDDEEDENYDVCCVACGDFVCKFNDEWDLKDKKGECVCEDCWKSFFDDEEEEEEEVRLE